MNIFSFAHIQFFFSAHAAYVTLGCHTTEDMQSKQLKGQYIQLFATRKEVSPIRITVFTRFSCNFGDRRLKTRDGLAINYLLW